MNFLFIHQNFPGQFRELAPYLHSLGHEIKAICSHTRPVDPCIDVIRYSEPSAFNSSSDNRNRNNIITLEMYVLGDQDQDQD